MGVIGWRGREEERENKMSRERERERERRILVERGICMEGEK